MRVIAFHLSAHPDSARTPPLPPNRLFASRDMRGRLSPLSFDFALRLPLAIPVLSQYVDFLTYVLERIGERVGSGGMAIIIFTIIIRTLILPITIRSTKSMKAM